MKFCKKFFLILICLINVLLIGCANNDKELLKNKNAYLTVTDDANRIIELDEKPEKIICLSNSYLEMIDKIDGKIIGRVTSKVGEIPDNMKNVPEVGLVNNINMEKIIGLQPDLVIANKNQHEKFVKLFDSNKIKIISINPKTYDEIKEKFLLIAEIYGNKIQAEKTIATMDNEILSIKDKIKDKKHPSIVIMHATPSNVTVELEHSIAGSIAKMLDFKNIADGSSPIKGKPEKTPYSIETLLANDPDIIFITSMGDSKEVENRMRMDVKNNPAWSSLKAVKNDKVYALPERLFLLNPGLKYPEAVEYMAKIVYPEVGYEK